MGTAEAALESGRGLYIDGRWVAPEAGWIDDVDPTTEEVVATAPNATVEQVGEAIGAARAAADDERWSGLSPERRAECLTQLGNALFAERDAIIHLSRAEWACTDAAQMIQIDAPAFMALHSAELAVVPAEYEEEIWGASGRAVIRHEPQGVVSILTPWNFPHTMNVMKTTAALAAGNCVVLKPSPLTPLSGLLLARIVEEHTDIPPGVVNVVTTDSVAASEQLVTDPRVDMISFTGSTEIGRIIAAKAGAGMKRTLLELGGKSACILLDGVDLDALLPQVLYDGCTLHSGQACILQSRLLVPNAMRADVVARLAELAGSVRIGSPFEAESQMGPLISALQRERVEAHVADAVSDGAKVVAGGRRPDGFDRGFFYEPTVVDGVDPGSRLAQNEVFGPVLAVIGYDTPDEAVAIANNSPYGLSGAIHGADVDLATSMARRIRTGQIAVNGNIPGDAPFGGFKLSGVGREGGLSGVRAYTETKAVGLPA